LAVQPCPNDRCRYRGHSLRPKVLSAEDLARLLSPTREIADWTIDPTHGGGDRPNRPTRCRSLGTIGSAAASRWASLGRRFGRIGRYLGPPMRFFGQISISLRSNRRLGRARCCTASGRSSPGLPGYPADRRLCQLSGARRSRSGRTGLLLEPCAPALL